MIRFREAFNWFRINVRLYPYVCRVKAWAGANNEQTEDKRYAGIIGKWSSFVWTKYKTNNNKYNKKLWKK